MSAREDARKLLSELKTFHANDAGDRAIRILRRIVEDYRLLSPGQLDEYTKERAAKVIEEGFDRPGIHKKQDTCPHGQFGWQDCEQCAASAIRAMEDETDA